jgi:hypothetical protein
MPGSRSAHRRNTSPEEALSPGSCIIRSSLLRSIIRDFNAAAVAKREVQSIPTPGSYLLIAEEFDL